jgi:RNA polymerase sigma-70 factor (ECF subfamily)
MNEESEVGLQHALATDMPERSIDWLESIYRDHAAAVVQTAYRVTGNVADAEDVLQTVFVRLAKREQPPDLSRGALPYLRRAATNAALDVVQARRTRSQTPLESAAPGATADPAPTQERIQLGRQIADELRAAIARLNRRQAEIFILKYFEDLDHRRIAEQLGTSPGTVAVTLHRVRSRLAIELSSLIPGAGRGHVGGKDD